MKSYTEFTEAFVHPNHKELDANNNGKVDAHDFKLLRKKAAKKSEIDEAVVKLNLKKILAKYPKLKDYGVSSFTMVNGELHTVSDHSIKPSGISDSQIIVAAGIREEVELDEAITPMHIKQAIGIANDKRYKGGNMTGAVSAMEKLHPGLSNHPKVKDALRLANESVELSEGGWPLPGQPMKTTATITKNKDGSTTTSFPDGTWKIESKNYIAKKKPTNLIYTHAKSDVAYQNLVYSKKGSDNYQLNKEEVELDEISTATLDRYRQKSDNKAGRALAYDKSVSHGYAKVQSSEIISKSKKDIKDLIKPEHHAKYPISKIATRGSALKIYRDASVAGHLKEEVELDEAKKEPMEVYHSGYSAALQHAEKHLNKQGYEIHPDDWQHHISHGPTKPSEGKTVHLHIPLQKDGVKSKKVAHIQVYNRGDKIPKNNELNMYVS